jgi:hypothetical protein
MKEMCNIKYEDYDKITDKVMWLGTGTALYFTTELYYLKKTKDGEFDKYNFHKEISYKYKNTNKIKIIRNFTYYFSIDLNTKFANTKVFIGPNEIYFLLFNLKEVLNWFIGENGINKIFMKNSDGKLFIPSHPDSIKVKLLYNTYIEFEAAIELINGYEVIGVKCYLNNDVTFFFMTSDTVFSLYHMLSTSNMYMMAQNMLNYINRPDYGTNIYAINSNKNTNQSFFNRVGAKENGRQY